ncbi:hypothetical protein AB4144_44535, partial [Rhizobiaceae sp. 2RAB30]
ARRAKDGLTLCTCASPCRITPDPQGPMSRTCQMGSPKMKQYFGPGDMLLEAACVVAVPATLLLTVVLAGFIIL